MPHPVDLVAASSSILAIQDISLIRQLKYLLIECVRVDDKKKCCHVVTRIAHMFEINNLRQSAQKFLSISR